MWERFFKWLIRPWSSGVDFFCSILFLACMTLLGMTTSRFLSNLATKEDLKQAVSELRKEIRSQHGTQQKTTGNKDSY